MSLDTLFTPLALTPVLSLLPLDQTQVDYHSDRRGKAGLLDQLKGSGQVSVILVAGDHLALPSGSCAVSSQSRRKLRLALLPGGYLPEQVGADSPALYYLGSRPHYQSGSQLQDETAREGAPGSREQHYFALDIKLLEGQTELDPFLNATRTRFDWLDVKTFAPHGSALEVGLAVSAVALAAWHGSQGYCSYCGAPTSPANNGWTRVCQREGAGRIFFPRIEPAVITAIVDRQDRMLFVHNRAWPEGLYSLCAGFVEAGESLEHAVRREAMEELSVSLKQMVYLGSQPWPFPASLMVAFKALAADSSYQVDADEVSQASWLTRDQYAQELAEERMRPPGKASLARSMIEQWFGSTIDL